jgi:hypothetical protein
MPGVAETTKLSENNVTSFVSMMILILLVVTFKGADASAKGSRDASVSSYLSCIYKIQYLADVAVATPEVV